MKAYTTDRLRNVVLVGHQAAGKTTLAEALLYNTGAISRQGRIEDKNTVSDWDDDERDRGISLSTSLLPLEWHDFKINLLDTPGFSDFQGEIKNAIRVADSVILVVDAVNGVEVGTELVWDYAQVYQQPIIVVINKIDRDNASFDGALASLRARFPDTKFIPVTMPLGEQSEFAGVINLVTMKAYMDAGGDETRTDIPAAYADAAAAARTALGEAATEADDAYIEKYFEEGDLTGDEIRDGMRKAARDPYHKTVPVFVASGLKNIGTLPLLEAFTVYVSAPSARRVQVIEMNGERAFKTAPQRDEMPLAAYVFKTTSDRFVGTLSFFRIFRGVVTKETRAFNTTQGVEERFNSLLTMRGKEQIEVTTLHCGDIGVVAKLTGTKTGDTLGTKEEGFQIVRPSLPAPLYQVALSPRTQADSSKMGTILTALCDADPTLRWRQDPQIKQTILEGMGDIHVTVSLARAEHLGVGIDVDVPRVPYRETIQAVASATHRHKKQTGGSGQFGEVSLRLEPNPGGGYAFKSEVVGGAVSSSYFPSIEKGIHSLLEEGALAGFPIVDVLAVVYDGKEHPVDSKDIAFQVAGREAFKEAFMAAKPTLLEPIVDARITVPEALMGDILGDLNTRRARVQGIDSDSGRSIITAQVPLAEMLRYGNALRALTGGRGIYTMTFSRYEPMPHHVAEGVIAAHSK